MAKRLVSFGSSVVFGAELKDTNGDTIPSRNSFAAIIAARYGLDYTCKAMVGGSNDTIVKLITDYTRTDIQDDFVLIGWTSVYRRDYMFGNHMQTFHVGNPHGYKNFVIQDAHDWIMANATTNIINQTFLDEVYRVHILLEHFGIPHAMINCLGDVESPLILKVQDIQSWTTDNSFPLGPRLHPLEYAHAKYAELLIPELRKLILTSQVQPESLRY